MAIVSQTTREVRYKEVATYDTQALRDWLEAFDSLHSRLKGLEFREAQVGSMLGASLYMYVLTDPIDSQDFVYLSNYGALPLSALRSLVRSVGSPALESTDRWQVFEVLRTLITKAISRPRQVGEQKEWTFELRDDGWYPR